MSSLPELTSDVHLVGESAATVVIDGNGTGGVFLVNRHRTAWFEGLTITGGHAADKGGGAFVHGRASFEDCVISGNTADVGGGGIYVHNDPAGAGFARILRSEISYNDTAGSGGGILAIDGFDGEAVYVHQSAVFGNTSASGGAGISHDRSLPGTSVMPVLQANGNWWGTPTGPTHWSNPGGTGDTISDEVTALSYCVDPACAATAGPSGESDLVMTIEEVYDPVTDREDIDHRIRVTNNGPDDASNVRFWVFPPDGVQYEMSRCTSRLGDYVCGAFNIPPGATYNWDARLYDAGLGDIETEAFVVADQADPAFSDNHHVETSSVITAPTADLELTATGPTEAFVGQPVTLEVTVENLGPDSMVVDGTGLETERGGTVQVFPVLFGSAGIRAATLLSAQSADGDCTIFEFAAAGMVFQRADCALRDLDVAASSTITAVISAPEVGTLTAILSAAGFHHYEGSVGPNHLDFEVAILADPCADATVVGTDGDDLLIGTNGPDIIAGGAGNDLIVGLGGDDILCGGEGNDLILAGPDADTAYGDAGDDVLFGSSGDDTLDGGAGADAVFGGRGEDTCPTDEEDFAVCEQ